MHGKGIKILLLIASIPLLGLSCIRIKTTAGDAGVFFSKDGGASWEHKVFVREEKKKTVTIAGEGIVALTFDPGNPSTLYAATEESGVYKTENGGSEWNMFLPTQGRTHAIAVHPKDQKTVFIAVGERVLRTRDGGKAWEISYTEPRPKVAPVDLAVDSFDPRKVYLALSNGDLMRSLDAGASWALLYHTESPIVQILIHPKDTRVITLVTQHHGLSRTTNLGKTWESLRATLEPYSDSQRGYAVATNPRDPSHLLYVSNFGLLETKNGGKSWNEIPLLAKPNVAPIAAFALASKNMAFLYYVTGTTLYRSRDHGKTWTTSVLPTSKRPAVLLPHPQNEALLYIGVSKQKK